MTDANQTSKGANELEEIMLWAPIGSGRMVHSHAVVALISKRELTALCVLRCSARLRRAFVVRSSVV